MVRKQSITVTNEVNSVDRQACRGVFAYWSNRESCTEESVSDVVGLCWMWLSVCVG